MKVRYRRGLLKMMDLYGSTKKDNQAAVDIIISMKVLFPDTDLENPSSEKGGLHSYGKTLVIDLNRSEKDMYADIHKNARYKINRASKRDPIIYHELTSPSDDDIRKFIHFFDRFAKYKKLPKGNFGRLKELRDQNALIMSYMTDEDLNVLCYHAYLKTDTYCSLLYSASARFENSQIRNMIGRANRFLHWQDIVSFKKKGLKWYDFGGLFVQANDVDEQNNNQFKKEFGGQEVNVDKHIYSLSILGKIIVILFRLKTRKRPDFLRAKMLHNNRYAPKNT